MGAGIADQLAPIPMSPTLGQTLARSAQYAQDQAHTEVALDHLLLALSEDSDARQVLEGGAVDISGLQTDVSQQIGNIEARLPGEQGGTAKISEDLKRILNAAAVAAKAGRRPLIDGAIVLAAIIGDGKTNAAALLRAHGLTFEAAINAIRNAPQSPPPEPAPQPPLNAPSQASRTPSQGEASPPPPTFQPDPQPQPNPAPPASHQGERPRDTSEILAAARERVASRKATGYTDNYQPETRPRIQPVPKSEFAPEPEPIRESEPDSAPPAGGTGTTTDQPDVPGSPAPPDGPQPEPDHESDPSQVPLEEADTLIVAPPASPTVTLDDMVAGSFDAELDNPVPGQEPAAARSDENSSEDGGSQETYGVDGSGVEDEAPQTGASRSAPVAQQPATPQPPAPAPPAAPEPVNQPAPAPPPAADSARPQPAPAPKPQRPPPSRPLSEALANAALQDAAPSPPPAGRPDTTGTPPGQSPPPPGPPPHGHLPTPPPSPSNQPQSGGPPPQQPGAQQGSRGWAPAPSEGRANGPAQPPRGAPPPMPPAATPQRPPAPPPANRPPLAGPPGQPIRREPPWTNPPSSANPPMPSPEEVFKANARPPQPAGQSTGQDPERAPAPPAPGTMPVTAAPSPSPAQQSRAPQPPPPAPNTAQTPSTPAPSGAAPVASRERGRRQTQEPSAQAPTVLPGQLIETVPRRMRVGISAPVEVRIAKAEVKAISDGLDVARTAFQHDIQVTKAMSVRLRAPDGGFFIETASPETQWIENALGLMADDYACWRWTVTPKTRGKRRLQLIVAARTVGPDGLAAETALPDQVIEIKVATNYSVLAKRFAGWAVAAIIGGLLAQFGAQIWTSLEPLIKSLGQ